MTEEIKISDISLLLGMSTGLLYTALQFVPDSQAKFDLQEKFNEIQGMINKIYYQDRK